MKVSIHRSPAQLERFAERWRRFELTAATGYFHTWAWAGSILACLKGKLAVQGVLVELRGEPALMCLFYADAALREWSAIEPGTPDTFALCSEYNLPLLAPGLSDDESRSVISGMLGCFAPATVLRFSAVPTAFGELLRACGCEVDVWRTRLAPILAFGDGQPRPPSARGEKARRLRRAAQLYAPLAVEHASDAAQRSAMLAELIELHGELWRSRGKPGVFNSESMRRFHAHLVVQDEAGDGVALFRVRTGSQTIAVLYCLRHRRCFYAYQSGIVYDGDNRKSPGLLTHSLFASHLAQAGASSYNMLACDFPYKRALTNSHEQLDWLRVHRGSASPGSQP